jgi:hypothetical protein
MLLSNFSGLLDGANCSGRFGSRCIRSPAQSRLDCQRTHATGAAAPRPMRASRDRTLLVRHHIRVPGIIVQIYTLRPTCSRDAFGEKRRDQHDVPTISGKQRRPKRPHPKTLCQPLLSHGALNVKNHWKISHLCYRHPFLRVHFTSISPVT